MNRWIANHLGLVNFWYYDEEIFELAGGKILLRGSNGSGKSVTMQSFVPLLLDGNKAPERIDPFGTKSRKIENYLLDENTDEKTAYLYIEFKRKETDNYLTIGMGMKAVKNKPLQSWYFLITDNRRIGKELHLYRDIGQKVPLTKKQLENEIGEGGIYLESQGAYMAKVNEYLFGFDSIDAYDELLSLLINLRSPKLSKDFKPTEIYKILTDSLKVLSEDDLRPMSESMENMDSLQSSLDTYRLSKKACNTIQNQYSAYNQYCLVSKAKKVLQEKMRLEQTLKQKQQKEICLSEQKAEKIKLTQEEEKGQFELQRAEEKYDSLSDREELKIKKQLIELEERLKLLDNTIKAKEKQLESKKENKTEIDYKLKDEKNQYELIEKEILETLETLEDLGEWFAFEEGKYLKEDIMENTAQYSFEGIVAILQRTMQKLKEAKKALEVFEKVKQEEVAALERKDKAQKVAEDKKREWDQARDLILEAKEDYKVNVVTWQKQAIHMEVTPLLQTELFRMVEKAEKFQHLIEIDEKVSGVKQQKQGNYVAQLHLKEKEIEQNDVSIQEIEDKIRDIKNAKEVEIPREKGVLENRKLLKEAGIPFIPLYKAIDFKKETGHELAATIESALVDMGLLDALIINPEDLEKCLKLKSAKQDKYLAGTSKLMSYNIGQYLKVEEESLEGVRFESVDNALMSVLLDEDCGAYIGEDGCYGLGILKGKTTREYEPKYVGVSARKKHREQVIEAYEGEITLIKQKIEHCKVEKQAIDALLVALNEEYKAFPKLEDLKNMLELSEKIEKEYTLQETIYLQEQEAYAKISESFQAERINVYEKTQGIALKKNLESYEEALDYADKYKETLTNLKISQNNLQACNSKKKNLEEHLDNLEEDIDVLYREIHQYLQDEKEQKAKKITLEEILETVDITQIEKEIEWCLQIKKEMPTALKHLNSRLGELKNQISSGEEEILKLQTQQQEEQTILQKTIEIFELEQALGYVEIEKTEDIIGFCKKVKDSYELPEDRTKEDYTSTLIDTMNKNNSELKEYNLKVIKIQDRIDLRGKIDGKEMDFYHLEQTIDKYIEETQILISEEERHVFEEVLLNTISTKITSKIWLSKQWVDKINSLMGSMNTSSSLKLSLKWIPQKAEVEGQLHISELLSLLERGDRCSEEDLKKIAKHFAAKVKEGIRNYEGSGETRNYHTIIKEVLDYRKWYEFKLSYEKKNENKKELTNNAFFQFSGGEKAMSMYIPLFSAVYARYDGASKECPRIIAMDEAFAGVDENNIRDMFRLLRELDLDFMINSQVLWGDYDTVDELSICEIIREENDTTVVVIRYGWNGKEKVLL